MMGTTISGIKQFNAQDLSESSAPSLETMLKLNSLFNLLGATPKENIVIIVEKATELFNGCCSLYDCFDERRRRMRPRVGFHLPGDFRLQTENERINCYQNVAASSGRDGASCQMAESIISEFGLKTCICHPVQTGDKTTGLLCVFDDKKRSISADDILLISVFAKVISREETRIQKEVELKRRLAYEEMLKDISNLAISFRNDALFLDKCLKIMGTAFNVGGVFLYGHDSGQQTLSRVSEWMVDGIPSKKDQLQGIPIASIPWAFDIFKNGEIMKFTDVEEFPGGREKEIIHMLGVRSLLVVPLFIKQSLFGLLGFEEFEYPRKWKNEDVNILKTAGQIICKAIEHKQAEDELIKHDNQLKQSFAEQTDALELADRKLKKEIAERKRTIKLLKEKEKDLVRKNRELEDINTTLKVLTGMREKDLGDLEERLFSNVRNLVDPALKRLHCSGLNADQKKWLAVLEANLDQITSPLVDHLATVKCNLTSTELKIASLIKHNKTTKEIAELLGLSHRTVEVHRSHVRDKMGLKNRKINLRSYLLSLD